MEFRLEVVPVPVSDVDQAKRFYSEQLGFAVDLDTKVNDRMRFVQLTPPGSACSIVIGAGTDKPPGSVQGLQLIVNDITHSAERKGREHQPGPALRRRDVGGRARRPLELVCVLQRSRRQQLGAPGEGLSW